MTVLASDFRVKVNDRKSEQNWKVKRPTNSKVADRLGMKVHGQRANGLIERKWVLKLKFFDENKKNVP